MSTGCAVVLEFCWIHKRPSHIRTAVSTWESCSVVSAPKRRKSFGQGIVTRFCASNAPERRNFVSIATSNRNPRTLVVRGTMVTRARSVSAAGTLSTRQGRTFATIPRSTSHTSPRIGSAICFLVPIEPLENRIGNFRQSFVGKRRLVECQTAPEDCGCQRSLVGIGKRIKGVQEVLNICSHSDHSLHQSSRGCGAPCTLLLCHRHASAAIGSSSTRWRQQWRWSLEG